jgi:hypothetical protein
VRPTLAVVTVQSERIPSSQEAGLGRSPDVKVGRCLERSIALVGQLLAVPSQDSFVRIKKTRPARKGYFQGMARLRSHGAVKIGAPWTVRRLM